MKHIFRMLAILLVAAVFAQVVLSVLLLRAGRDLDAQLEPVLRQRLELQRQRNKGAFGACRTAEAFLADARAHRADEFCRTLPLEKNIAAYRAGKCFDNTTRDGAVMDLLAGMGLEARAAAAEGDFARANRLFGNALFGLEAFARGDRVHFEVTHMWRPLYAVCRKECYEALAAADAPWLRERLALLRGAPSFFRLYRAGLVATVAESGGFALGLLDPSPYDVLSNGLRYRQARGCRPAVEAVMDYAELFAGDCVDWARYRAFHRRVDPERTPGDLLWLLLFDTDKDLARLDLEQKALASITYMVAIRLFEKEKGRSPAGLHEVDAAYFDAPPMLYDPRGCKRFSEVYPTTAAFVASLPPDEGRPDDGEPDGNDGNGAEPNGADAKRPDQVS